MSSSHFSMGAINKITNKYEYPKIANKINKYKCPSCDKNVIFRKGLIKQPHFAHYKSDNSCSYYDKPNETQIHKDAKLLMKTLLDNKRSIHIVRNCNYCEQRNCYYIESIDCGNIDYNENTKAVVEHKFYYNDSRRSADVALLENDEIKYIFEICHKNKTDEENRPEPWFDIKAETLINDVNSCENINEDEDEDEIEIECIRDYKCAFCIGYEEDEQERQERQKIYYAKLREDQERQKIYYAQLKEDQERQKIYYVQLREERERETLKQKEEEKKNRQDEMKNLCNCGIMIQKICKCKIPQYQLNKLSNNLFCEKCDNWKCRC